MTKAFTSQSQRIRFHSDSSYLHSAILNNAVFTALMLNTALFKMAECKYELLARIRCV